MNRITTLIAALFLAIGVSAQSVTVDAKIDSLEILIGEQTRMRLQVSMDAKQHAHFPLFTDTIVKGVEILETAKPDSQLLNSGKRLIITQEYTVTSFDSALYYIPPMEVMVDNMPYQSNSLALKVYSVPVDTTQVDQFFGPKDIQKVPFVWSDWIGLIVCAILLVPMGILLVYLAKRLKDNKPIIRKVKVEPKLPAHQTAMNEIERIKAEKIWQKGQQKEYYTELTDVIRNYIMERFHFNAMEMTSSEIIEHLLETDEKKDIDELKELFVTADLVKFAKHDPMMNENDANLVSAIDFINETKQEELEDQKPQPTEITIVEKRPLRTKILLITSIVVLSAALIGAVVYIGLQLYNVVV